MKQLLATPSATREVLEKHGIHAKKKYGQNFLIDANIIRGIIDAAGITKEDCVLEIGPGIGSMTQLLSQAAGKVVCVEIDRSLEPILADTLSDYGNVDIIWQDILKTDVAEIAASYNGGRPLKVVANLPYYVTTPILMELLSKKGCFESITVMIQKEVADRIKAEPGTRDYGALSLAVSYYADPQVVMTVPPSCFIPRPGVDSAVLCLRAFEEPPVEADEAYMLALIRAAFNQRRKALSNALTHGLAYKDVHLTREEVTGALETMGLSPTIRGEALGLSDFARLSHLLEKESQE